jgi:hypothetical protein
MFRVIRCGSVVRGRWLKEYHTYRYRISFKSLRENFHTNVLDPDPFGSVIFGFPKPEPLLIVKNHSYSFVLLYYEADNENYFISNMVFQNIVPINYRCRTVRIRIRIRTKSGSIKSGYGSEDLDP